MNQTQILLLVCVALGAFILGRVSKRVPERTVIPKNEPEEISLRFEANVSGDIAEDIEQVTEPTDAWEGGFWDASDPKKLSIHLEIDYIDGGGRKTERSVKVREFDNELYGGILIGDCELRNAKRTFRFDRIKRAVDIESGELITDIRSYLNKVYEQSPEKSIEILTSDFIDVLKILFFVAKADGQYRKEEKVVVAGYVRELLADDRVTDELIDAEMRYMDLPSLQAYKNAVGRVVRGGQVNPSGLLDCCNDIVATQKQVHPAEKVALDYLSKKAEELRADA